DRCKRHVSFPDPSLLDTVTALVRLARIAINRQSARSQTIVQPDVSPEEPSMSVAAPFVSKVMEIEKDWIDYNGHLNMAYYNVLFDRASDDAFELMGLGPAYARERKLTVYTAEVHICYVQELHLGDRVRVSFQLLDHDEKRFIA